MPCYKHHQLLHAHGCAVLCCTAWRDALFRADGVALLRSLMVCDVTGTTHLFGVTL